MLPTQWQIVQEQSTVFIVDDDSAILRALCAMVDSMGLRSECYRSAEQFLAGFRPDVPGCIVLDVRMPNISGIELLQELRKQNIRTPVIIVTGHGDVSTSVNAFRAGAFHFFEKPFPLEDLDGAIREALAEDLSRRQSEAQRAQATALLNRLTAQEKCVLAGVLLGKTNAEIADELDVSPRTIQFRRTSGMRKLEVTSKAELLDLFLAAGCNLLDLSRT